MSTFEFVLLLVLIIISSYNGWVLTNLSMKGINMALSPETQEQLDRIDQATTQIGAGVTSVAQRIVDLTNQIANSGGSADKDVVAALQAEATKLEQIGSDLTILASPADPSLPTG